MLGRLGLSYDDAIPPAAVAMHGIRCGEIPGLDGLVLARENNQDARRTKAPVAGSRAAWSQWAEQVLDGLQEEEIDALLKLHPLLRDHDLPGGASARTQ